MRFVTHANIACGFHASDPVVMQRTVRAAKAAGIRVDPTLAYPIAKALGGAGWSCRVKRWRR